MRETGWVKSTRSTSGGDNCVEVRVTDTVASVRDSKNPNGGHLNLGRSAFAALVAGVRQH